MAARQVLCRGIGPLAIATFTMAMLAASFASVGQKSVSADDNLGRLARLAVSENQEVAEDAVTTLREAGQAGLDAMFRVHGDVLAAQREMPAPFSSGWSTPEAARIKQALEAVARQYDVHASCLFWHDDLESAKSAAEASGKPILLLRMLGNLDEECSCANSRFFRTALYANQDVAQYLRDNFVLCWQSVRPVPKITIDFGDGRVIERTITGNSAHYVLSPDGRVVDVFPGLYGPKAFLNGIRTAAEFTDRLLAAEFDLRDDMLNRYYTDSVLANMDSLRRDLAAVRIAQAEEESFNTDEILIAANDVRPSAADASNRSVGKRVIETSLLSALAIDATTIRENADTANAIDDETWLRIAARHAEDATLDDSSRELMREHGPSAATAALVSVSKLRVEDPMLNIIAGFERSIAEDTVRNEYMFRRQILEWLASEDELNLDAEYLNGRVYTELFLTPSSDPWLGLLSGGYSALRADGVRFVEPPQNEQQ